MRRLATVLAYYLIIVASVLLMTQTRNPEPDARTAVRSDMPQAVDQLGRLGAPPN